MKIIVNKQNIIAPLEAIIFQGAYHDRSHYTTSRKA
jgi:hypothetical protein